ncbi:hypothetical protein GGR56DRAFT_684101 [Xylariaceae sp. FL0804]|nr:hypothetical protein GGR56DRAFT_684101 [Xylariaceae sp. FL0804]
MGFKKLYFGCNNNLNGEGNNTGPGQKGGGRGGRRGAGPEVIRPGQGRTAEQRARAAAKKKRQNDRRKETLQSDRAAGRAPPSACPDCNGQHWRADCPRQQQQQQQQQQQRGGNPQNNNAGQQGQDWGPGAAGRGRANKRTRDAAGLDDTDNDDDNDDGHDGGERGRDVLLRRVPLGIAEFLNAPVDGFASVWLRALVRAYGALMREALAVAADGDGGAKAAMRAKIRRWDEIIRAVAARYGRLAHVLLPLCFSHGGEGDESTEEDDEGSEEGESEEEGEWQEGEGGEGGDEEEEHEEAEEDESWNESSDLGSGSDDVVEEDLDDEM